MPAADTASRQVDLLAEVAAAFGLGAVDAVEVLTAGTMNRSWRVAAAGGVAAVKEVLDVDAATARRQARTCRALASWGLPVPEPLSTSAGDHVIQLGAGVFTAARWVDGSCRPGAALSLAEAIGLGALLAELHLGLAAVLPGAAAAVVEPVVAAAAADERLAGCLERVSRAARAGDDAMDAYVLTVLPRRRRLLADVAELRPADGAACGPAGWVHGDFQHYNLLWQQGVVSGVLDWDRLRVRPLAAEVVRAATLIFAAAPGPGLDLPRVAAFAAGYRARMPLPDGALADAAHRLWWDRVCETWQLRVRYERGDTSCDGFFRTACELLWWWTPRRDEVLEALLCR